MLFRSVPDRARISQRSARIVIQGEIRVEGVHATSAAKVAVDSREKERLDRIAKEDQAKAIDIENDFS